MHICINFNSILETAVFFGGLTFTILLTASILHMKLGMFGGRK